jgi:polar amino acid transport system substrate-binding protein
MWVCYFLSVKKLFKKGEALIMRNFFIVIFIFAIFAVSAQSIVLDVPNFPPLSVIKGDQISGSFYDQTLKIMQAAGINAKYNITATYASALNDLKNGACDGFFPAVQTAERDEFAVISKPVIKQNWIWIKLKSSNISPTAADFKSKTKVGTLMQTAQENFLKTSGYNITGSPATLDSLVTMLVAGRFDIVLTNEDTWDVAVKNAGKDPNTFTKFVERTTTVGIYISKAILAKNPDLMNKLNDGINKIVK